MKESKKVKEKYYKDEHVILGKHNSGKVEKLYELYEEDKFKARVYYMNEKVGFTNSRLVLFLNKNGDFSLEYTSTVSPLEGGDGFFLAILKKIK